MLMDNNYSSFEGFRAKKSSVFSIVTSLYQLFTQTE